MSKEKWRVLWKLYIYCLRNWHMKKHAIVLPVLKSRVEQTRIWVSNVDPIQDWTRAYCCQTLALMARTFGLKVWRRWDKTRDVWGLFLTSTLKGKFFGYIYIYIFFSLSKSTQGNDTYLCGNHIYFHIMDSVRNFTYSIGNQISSSDGNLSYSNS